MNKIIVQKDQARLYGRPYPIPQGQSQFSEIEFSFSEDWANLRKIAQFEQKSGPYNVDISDNKCFCPSELVKGWVNIRVKGYPEDTTSAVIATANEIILPVSMGFKPGGTPPVPPTPDLYQKLIGEFSDKVQSDWNQNNPTAKDYVRNRTHYVSRESRAVVPEREVTTAVQNNFNFAVLNGVDLDAFQKLYNSEDDTTFDVVFDGTSYSCKWLEQNGSRIPIFGNLAIVKPSMTDTGEPFYIGSKTPNATGPWMIICKIAGTHTVAVIYKQDVVHTIDPKYIGEISGETLSVTGTVEFASDSWASDYSYFTDSWLTMNADSAKIAIEINGKLVEDLPYSPGGYGAFTFGNVDTLGVAITNSGYGTSTQRVTVSTTVFPNGIKAARVFRKIAYRIPVDSLPKVISWIAKRTEDEFVLTGNRKFVNDNEATQVTDTIPSYNVFDVYDHDLMLLKCHTGQSFFDMSNTNRISIRHGTGGVIETVDVLMPDGTPVTADNWPKGATLLGIDRVRNVYLLNPRSNELILPSSTTDSTKKFRITVDDTGTISATEVSPP